MATYRGTARTINRRTVSHPQDIDAGRPGWYVEAIATEGPAWTTRTIRIDVDGAPCSFPLSMANAIVLGIEAAADWLNEYHPIRPAGELPERTDS